MSNRFPTPSPLRLSNDTGFSTDNHLMKGKGKGKNPSYMNDVDAMGYEEDEHGAADDRGPNYIQKVKARKKGLEIVFDPKAHK